MNKKYWINKDFNSIKKAFDQFCSHNRKDIKSMRILETSYFSLDNFFKYAYVTHELRRSSWSDEDDYVENNQYSQEELEQFLSFLISLIVPRLKRKYINQIIKDIFKKSLLKYGADIYFCDFYTSSGCDKKYISIEDLYLAIENFLKENNLFREKNFFEPKII
jgi:hypothetical protein